MSRNQRPFGGPDQRIYFSSSKLEWWDHEILRAMETHMRFPAISRNIPESKGNRRVIQLPARHLVTQSGQATVVLFYCNTLQ